MLEMSPLKYNELKSSLNSVLQEMSHLNPHLIPQSYRLVTRGLLAELNHDPDKAKECYLQSTHPIAFQRYNYLNSVNQNLLPTLNFIYKPRVVNISMTSVPLQFEEAKAPAAPQKAQKRTQAVPESNRPLKIKADAKPLTFIAYQPKKADELSTGEKNLLLKLYELSQTRCTAKPTFAFVAQSLNRVEDSIIDIYFELQDRKILGVWPQITELGQNMVKKILTDKSVKEQTKPEQDYRMKFKHILN